MLLVYLQLLHLEFLLPYLLCYSALARKKNNSHYTQTVREQNGMAQTTKVCSETTVVQQKALNPRIPLINPKLILALSLVTVYHQVVKKCWFTKW